MFKIPVRFLRVFIIIKVIIKKKQKSKKMFLLPFDLTALLYRWPVTVAAVTVTAEGKFVENYLLVQSVKYKYL